ncbi:MAG TPA: hypothetical protein DC054_24545 [Blastocatellia bacterium]|nr:hypothetical protein [Blastocatellia bacterium]
MSASDLVNSSETNWEQVDRMTDEEIDTSDIPVLDEAFFANARLRVPEGKVSVLMNVDAEVFEWFKSQGPEYQNLINRALRAFAETHKA